MQRYLAFRVLGTTGGDTIALNVEHVDLKGEEGGFLFTDDEGSILINVALTGDPTGDGFVGIADLNIVLSNWNAGTPPGTGNVIPEPVSAAMLTVGALSILRRRSV